MITKGKNSIFRGCSLTKASWRLERKGKSLNIVTNNEDMLLAWIKGAVRWMEEFKQHDEEEIFKTRSLNDQVRFEWMPFGKKLRSLLEKTKRLTCLDETYLFRRFHPLADIFLKVAYQRDIVEVIGCISQTQPNDPRIINQFKDFLRILRDTISASETRQLVASHERLVGNNIRSATEFIRGLVQQHGHLQILRLELSYESPDHFHKTIAEIRIRHRREHLIRYIKNNIYSQGVTGYLWKVEDGKFQTFTIHMFMFFEKNFSKLDVVAKQIIDEWSGPICEGKGFGAPRPICRELSDDPGITQVEQGNRHNTEQLTRTIRCLLAMDFFTRPIAPGIRLFGKSAT